MDEVSGKVVPAFTAMPIAERCHKAAAHGMSPLLWERPSVQLPGHSLVVWTNAGVGRAYFDLVVVPDSVQAHEQMLPPCVMQPWCHAPGSVEVLQKC